MFDFLLVKKTLASYGNTLKKMQLDIELLHRERENVVFAPPTRADVRAAMAVWVSTQANAYRESITVGVTALALNAATIEDPKRFNEVVSRLPLIHKRAYGPVEGPVDLAICALLGDGLLKAFDGVLEQIAWPSGALTANDRKRKLEQIDARLAELVEGEQKMLAAAAEAGLTPDI